MDATIGVIGLGALGSQALMQISLAGVSTIGFDRSTTPNDRSGHAGETRLVLAMSEGPESESREKITAGTLTAWEKFEAVTGHSVMMRNGSLLLGRAGEDRTNFLVSSAEQMGEPLQVLNQKSAKEKFPQFNLDPEEVAVYDPRGGGVRSEWAVWGAISTARRTGAQIRTSEEVLGWAPEQGCVRVFTTVREYKFEKIIVSAGAYVKSLVPTVPVIAHWLAMVLAWFAPETD